MAITFLQAVNATLKRVGEIAGDAEALATSTVTSTATGLTATDAFTNSRIQRKIDITIQVWNEVMHELYGMGLYAQEAATATLTLVAAQREYDLPSDFERFAGVDESHRVLRGATNGLILREYDGGYAGMLADQPFATQYTGSPGAYAISPAASKIRLDAEPTSDEAGETYNYLYEKRVALTSTMATSTLPFSDTVADSALPVVAETYERIMKKDFDAEIMKRSLNRALEFIRQNQRRDRWGTRRGC